MVYSVRDMLWLKLAQEKEMYFNLGGNSVFTEKEEGSLRKSRENRKRHSQDSSQTLAFPFTQSPHLLKQWSEPDFPWGNVCWPSLDCGRTKSISLSRCDLSNDKVFTVKTLLNYILTGF